MTAPSVIVIGASGNLGPSIVQALIEQKADLGRIAILASPDRANKFSKYPAQGVEVVIGSFTEPNSFKGFDVVISLTGNAIMAKQPEIIDAAVAAGVRHFFPSEFGVDISQPAFLKELYFHDKHITREHLRKKAKEVPGFSYTFVVIGFFAETFALSPVFGLNKANRTFEFYGDAESEGTFSSMSDSARYTVSSILMPLDPGQSERVLRIPNENWKIKDATELLGRVEGVEYKIKYLPLSVARDLQEKYRQSGDTSNELYTSLKVVFGSPFAVVPKPWDNDKFPFTPLTLEQIFRSFQA